MKNNVKKLFTAMAVSLCLGCVAVGVDALQTNDVNALQTNDEVFRIVEGASVKVNTDEHTSGIRFTFLVEEDYFDTTVSGSDTVTINTAVVPTKMIDGEVTAENLLATASAEKETITADKWTKVYKWDLDGDGVAESEVDENGDTWLTSYAYLYDLPATAYNWDISAVGYIAVDGEVQYVTSVQTRTMSYVASAALYDETEDWNESQTNTLCAYLEGYDYNLTLGGSSATLMATDGETVYDVTTSAKISVTTNAVVPVTYHSDNEAVATVDKNGNITPVGGGTATITVSTNRILPENTTSSNETATFDVTVYDYYEIDTTAEFFAMETNNAYVHYALTNDIDFSDVLVNSSTDTLCVGMKEFGNLDTVESFNGVLDGHGYGFINVKMKGANAVDDNGIFACMFKQMGGTVKNLYADMTLSTSLTSVKQVGFIDTIGTAEAVVENCCFVLNVNQTAYGANMPPAAIASYASKAATIKNCVGVLNFADTIVNDNGLGYAAILGRAADTDLNISNCYGVVTSKDNVKAAQLYTDSEYSSSSKTPTVTNSWSYQSLADMYAAATTGMTKANGWNELWTVDAATESLKFGSKYIYPATELNVTSSELFLLNNNENENGVATELQLAMRGTDATVTAWSSSANGVATVENGLVTPVSAGTTTITATAGGVDYTCDITVYNYYEIDTYSEFLDMKTGDSTVYYALTKNIDFSEILVNGSLDTLAVGMDAFADSSVGIFTGVLDGNGYGLLNVTMKGAQADEATGINAYLICQMNGTVKNLYADLTISTDTTKVKAASIKQAGLIGTIASANAVVENCYVKIAANSAAYGTQTPVAAIAPYVTQAATIRNCVGIFECLDTFSAINGGYAAIAGRVGTTGLKIQNCYGVVLSTNNAQASKLYCDSTYNSAYKTPTVTNSTAHQSLAEVYAAISVEGVMETNGWNDMWKIENNGLYFGNMKTAIYTDTSAN